MIYAARLHFYACLLAIIITVSSQLLGLYNDPLFKFEDLICLIWWLFRQDDTFSHILLRGLVNNNLGHIFRQRLLPSSLGRRINQCRWLRIVVVNLSSLLLMKLNHLASRRSRLSRQFPILLTRCGSFLLVFLRIWLLSLEIRRFCRPVRLLL